MLSDTVNARAHRRVYDAGPGWTRLSLAETGGGVNEPEWAAIWIQSRSPPNVIAPWGSSRHPNGPKPKARRKETLQPG